MAPGHPLPWRSGAPPPAGEGPKVIGASGLVARWLGGPSRSMAAVVLTSSMLMSR